MRNDELMNAELKEAELKGGFGCSHHFSFLIHHSSFIIYYLHQPPAFSQYPLGG
jgi:hypothetical protein